jgi:hypothetical protein
VIRLIAATMADLMPRGADLPGCADCDPHGFLRRLRRESDPLFFLGLVLGTLFYQLAPVLTLRLPVPAVLLSERLRARHAQRMAAHPSYVVRQAVSLVRLSAGLCWGMDPAVRAHFALPPYGPDPGTFRRS